MFVHLKKDLDVALIDWKGCDEPCDSDSYSSKVSGDRTSYGIAKHIQRLLADIRTDLDSFTEAEAFGLMTSGYRMAETEFFKHISGFSQPAKPENWTFLRVEPAMQGGPNGKALEKHLRVARQQAFKVWRVNP